MRESREKRPLIESSLTTSSRLDTVSSPFLPFIFYILFSYVCVSVCVWLKEASPSSLTKRNNRFHFAVVATTKNTRARPINQELKYFCVIIFYNQSILRK